MYKSRLPFIACFNKIGMFVHHYSESAHADVDRFEKCIEWMNDYNAFYDAVMQDDSYMAR